MSVSNARIITVSGLLLFLVIAGGAVYRLAVDAFDSRQSVEDTYEAANATSRVFAALLDAEASARGFALTGSERHLGRLEAAKRTIVQDLDLLRQLTADDPEQQPNLDRLVPVANAKLAKVEEIVTARRIGGLDAARQLLESDRAGPGVDALRDTIAAIETEERRLLDARSADATLDERRALVSGAVGGAFALAVMGLGTLMFARSERDVRSKSASLEATLANIPQGVAVYDERERLVDWNPQFGALLGMEIPLKRGETTLSEIRADARARAQNVAPRAAMPRRHEFQIGDRFLESITRKLPQGGIIVTLIDTTERHAAEKMAAQAHRLDVVGRLSGGIAHHFNNLLTVIIGNVELAARETRESEVANKLEHALVAASRAAKLVAQLLSFARARPIRATLVDPRETIAHMANIVRATLGSGMTLDIDLKGGDEKCLIDEADLEFALLNIVANARDAMRDRGGCVSVRLETVTLASDEVIPDLAAGRYFKIAVGDTGVGMTADVAARAFEPFFTTKDVGQGSGLGLSQTHGIVRQAKGAVTLDSRPGEGTLASIYLPVAAGGARSEEAAAAAAAFPAPAKAGARAAEARILVVEDEDQVRDFVAQVLRAEGFAILEARDAEIADGIVAAEPIDLLCTDIIMPGRMTGIDLAKRACALQPGLRVVYMSGFPDAALKDLGLPNGNTVFLTKPFRAEELVATIEEALGVKQAEGARSGAGIFG